MGKKIQGGLYPTIAISDAFNALGHLIAASIAYEREYYVAAMGFLTVVVAATVGVLRFGFNELKYAQANGDLADISGFIGLPCVGISFLTFIPALNFNVNPGVIAVLLTIIEAGSRSFPPQLRELAKILVNVCFFVLPVLIASILEKNWGTFLSIVLFVVAGLVVKPERHQYLFGIRRENIFHYMIGVAALGISVGLH